MKSLVATLALLALTIPAGAAPPRVATVRVNDILLKLESTAKANDDYKVKREAIGKDKRKVTLDEMIADLELRRSKLSDNASIDAETRKKLLREYMLKQQEAKSLQEEFQNFSTEKQQALNAEMVGSIRGRLNLIHGTAEKIAKEEGFDWVFDSSGISNTGVPLMLYAKTPNDLTERVIAALGATKPAVPPAPAANENKNDKKPKR
ncbi:OmpH family outer membrane protein [Luteolibacter sp. Populi]|uniref:OmpH family outer membrane protein n=1 Tax=Luteolibacter sp. Populi TaxID=3230487 RepID=UPI0034656253